MSFDGVLSGGSEAGAGKPNGVEPGRHEPDRNASDGNEPDRSEPGRSGPGRILPDLILLAGGRGSRLGGAAKPAVTVAGRTLLSRALDARVLVARTVVVGPESSRAAAGAAAAEVLWALEDPPLGGPAAGVAAGLAALERDAATGPRTDAAGPSDWVLLLACDLPWAADAARLLLTAANAAAQPPHAAPRPARESAPESASDGTPEPDAHPDGALDGIHLVDADGRAQWLAGLYRASALTAAVRLAGPDLRGASIRGLLAGLTLRGIRDDSNAGRDVDTWRDVAAAEALLKPPAKPSSE